MLVRYYLYYCRTYIKMHFMINPSALPAPAHALALPVDRDLARFAVHSPAPLGPAPAFALCRLPPSSSSPLPSTTVVSVVYLADTDQGFARPHPFYSTSVAASLAQVTTEALAAAKVTLSLVSLAR